MKYIPQLDSIRGIAVVMVVVEHWTRFKRSTNIPLGDIGVDIFFVLSGFLITYILLEAKESERESPAPMKLVKNFYIRRVLRIFPLYYVAISVWFFMRSRSGMPTDDSIYYYLYISNYYMFNHSGGKLIPTWSLAVEEQFYILWPWIIVFLSQRRVLQSIIAFILIGIISKYVLWFTFGQTEKILLFTPTCFDSFGFGALLAYLRIYRYDYSKYRPHLKAITIASLAIIMVMSLMHWGGRLPLRTLVAFISIFLIDYCLTPKPDLAYTKIVSNNWLIQIGKISYGMYLIHNFIPPIWDSILNKSLKFIQIPYINYFPNSTWDEPIRFIQYSIVLLVVCSLSWKFFESRIIAMKKYFAY